MVVIREETGTDALPIRRLNEEAFGQAKFIDRSKGGDRAGRRDSGAGGETGEVNGRLEQGRKEEAMRKGAVIALVVMASFVLAASVTAESGVKEECVTLCKAAAKFIDEKGLDAGIAEIGDKAGKFVTKNTYVFLMDLEGNRLAHPYAAPNDPKIMKLFDMKDSTGKLFVQEYIEVAKTKGEGWTEYMYPKPEELKKPTPFNEKKSSKKISYVYRIPGKDLMVIAGFFE